MLPKDQYQQMVGVLELLCSSFPNTFFMYRERRKPIKIGIHLELDVVLGERVDRKLLRQTLKFYTINHGYLRALRAGAPRIDLNGEEAGSVTEEQAEQAGVVAMILAVRRRRKKWPLPISKKKPPPSPPPRDGLAALRAAARTRKQAAGGGS
jgi:ProP effector